MSPQKALALQALQMAEASFERFVKLVKIASQHTHAFDPADLVAGAADMQSDLKSAISKVEDADV